MATLLGPRDPAPVVIFNAEMRSPFLLVGDHAGTAIPLRLGALGLSSADLERHIACDIGVRGVGEALSQRLGATFIHQAYSRLVIDCNRDPAADDAIPALSDGTIISGNIGLTAADRSSRVSAIHAPYQHAIAIEIERRAMRHQPTTLISLHSFTPALDAPGGDDGFRPWHIGVLHGGGDAGFAYRLLAELAREPGLVVGDNEPYRLDDTDHTVPRHAFAADIPYAEIEIRQDLLAKSAGRRRWCALIAKALTSAHSGAPA